MRRKKKQRLKEEAFWAAFFFYSVPRHLDEVPEHIDRANFRVDGVDDEGLSLMVTKVRSIYQLDLDDTDITIEGLRHLTQLDFVKELRCRLRLKYPSRPRSAKSLFVPPAALQTA